MATYGKRYLFYFLRDRDKALIRTTVHKKDYTGPVTELKHDDEPVILKAERPDNLFEPLITRTATFGAMSQEGVFELEDLYTEDDRDIWIEIDQVSEQGTVLEKRFAGWITPYGSREAYKKHPYRVKFKATCGLDSLKDYPFYRWPDKTALLGNYSAITVIRNCIKWLGYSLPVYECIGVKEKSMWGLNGVLPSFPNHSTLQQTIIDTNLFTQEVGMMSCYDVLTTILKPLGILIQDKGAFKIVRVDEYPEYKTLGKFPFLVFDGLIETTFFGLELPCIKQVALSGGQAKPYEGGELSFNPSQKRVTINYQYGSYRNELKNGNFREPNLAGWTLSPDAQRYTLAGPNGDGTPEDPFCLRINGSINNLQNRTDTGFVFQELRVTAPNRGHDVYTLTIKYQNFDTRGLKIAVRLKIDALPGANRYFVLQEDGTWLTEENKKANQYLLTKNTHTDVNTGKEAANDKQETYTLEMSGIPSFGPYTLLFQIYRGVAIDGLMPNPHLKVYSVEVAKKEGEKREVNGEEVRVELPNADRRRSAETIDLLIGDQSSMKKTVPGDPIIDLTGHIIDYEPVNIYYPRRGAFYRPDGTPTELWKTRDGRTGKIQTLLGSGILRMMGGPAMLFAGDVLEAEDIGPLDILWLKDLDKYLMVRSHEEDLKAGSVKGDAVEILTVSGATSKGYFDTPDGLVAMNEKADAPEANGQNKTLPQQIEQYIRKNTDIPTKLGGVTAFTIPRSAATPTSAGSFLAVVGGTITKGNYRKHG